MPQHCTDYARSYAAAGHGLPAIEPGMPIPAGTGLTRRSLMLRSLGLGMAVYGAGAISQADRVEAAINDALGQHRVLISVFMDGGWDSLSVLAPFGTDHRHEARLAELRPGLSAAIDRGTAVPFSADPSLSWHPSAAGLRQLWEDPAMGVRVAPAIGYANANYSHFTSRHFWEVGALDTGGTTGWLGRYLDRVGRPDVPIQGVTLGGSLSPAMATSNVPVSAVYNVDNYSLDSISYGRVATAMQRELRALGAKASGDAQRDQSRMVTGAAFRLGDDLAVAKGTATPTVAYPTDQSYFIGALKDTARLLSTRVNGAALPIRAVSLRAHGGYDTHSGQAASFGNDLRITTAGIKAFWDDLRARGEDDRVVMLVWSEFGRRPNENGSAGCDHGAAGSAFVIGRSTNISDGLIGEFPGLDAYGAAGAGLMRDGNLRATADFRGLYSALLEQWLQIDADGIIPGAGARPGAGAFARPVLR